MRTRYHNGFGHGLRPGTDHDMNCGSCKREMAEGQEPEISGTDDPGQKIRTAAIQRRGERPTRDEVAAYLPRNYRILGVTPDQIFITGTDYAGWTMDDYVIPRLGSGLIHAKEITGDTDAFG